MRQHIYSLSLSIAMVFAAGAGAAWAAPVGVDGVLGAEWTGVTPTVVGYDATAATDNFGTPGANNHIVGYSVYYRADANYLYGLLLANGDTLGNNFANLYFNTDLAGGSDLGIEITNVRAFKPGVGGYFDLTAYLTVAQSAGNLNRAIEWSLDWDYINNDPDNILPAATDSANGIQLRSSQSFGYSVTAGDFNPANATGTRFGTVAQAAVAVPEPTSMALSALALLAAGAVRLRRTTR